MPEVDTSAVNKPLGAIIGGNLLLIREQRGLSYRQLSQRLTELGQPIPVLGLSRAERCERRLDLDELTALADALGVPLERLWTTSPACEVCSSAPPTGFICGSCGLGKAAT